MTKSIFETIIVDPEYAESAIEYAHSKDITKKRIESQKEWQNMPKARNATKDDLATLMKSFTQKAS
jgi:hypothetical protein